MTLNTTANALAATPAATAPIRPLRVLVAGYRSHPYVGGQGVYIRELTTALKALGHDVSVASGPPFPQLDPGIRLIELPSLDLFAESNAFLALRPQHLMNWADLSEWMAHNSGAFGELNAFALRLERYLLDHGDDFDVIHDNQTLMPPFARINKQIPVVATIHHPIAVDREFAIAAGQRWWEKLLSHRWYNFVDVQARMTRKMPRLLAVSESARQSHVEHYHVDAGKIRVAFNGIDHAVFHPDAETTREPGLIVTTASADAPIKGLDLLIKALAEIVPDRPNLRLHIIGQLRDGPSKRALEALGLRDRVTTSSGLSRGEIAQLYRRANVVACPARFEGFGFPAAEAMACGAAVCTSDGGALPEVVGDCGLVSPVEDTGALAANIASLIDAPEKAEALGAAAHQRARAAFNWEDHALAASQLYMDALAERGTVS